MGLFLYTSKHQEQSWKYNKQSILKKIYNVINPNETVHECFFYVFKEKVVKSNPK